MSISLAHNHVCQENNYSGSLERLTKAYFISNKGAVATGGASFRYEVHTDDGVDACELMPEESQLIELVRLAGFKDVWV